MSTPLITTAEIFVRDVNQTYTTNMVRGICTSCTTGAQAAAQRQAEKLFGPALISVEDASGDNRYTYRFIAKADPIEVAWCERTGTVAFGPCAPIGSVPLASGPSRALRAELERSAWQGKGVLAGKLVIPGVNEFVQHDEALEALQQWLAMRGPLFNKSRESYCVQYVSQAVVQAPEKVAA